MEVSKLQKLVGENVLSVVDCKNIITAFNQHNSKKYAEQQFIGFSHGKNDGDITRLVDGMVLGLEEWEEFKVEGTLLSEDDKKQVDDYFYENP